MNGVYLPPKEESLFFDEKGSLNSLPYEVLLEEVRGMGQPDYRAKQVFSWLHQKRVSGFEEMQNLPNAFRAALLAQWAIENPIELQRLESRDGTVKFLFGLRDGNCVEAVLMGYKHGDSLCISSQVGCRMGCRFCASTKGGLVRGLLPGEMVGQVYAAQKATGRRVNHIVLMGIGEPLDNFDNVVQFIEIITDARGQNLAGRNLSLSTCGLVPQIERLAKLHLPLTLSISLHAADDATRQELMPVAKRFSISQLLAACQAYQKETGRRVSYEYAVVPGVNDRAQDAEGLARRLRSSGGHINLIPVNPAEGSPYKGQSRPAAEAFQQKLCAFGLNATVRRSLGADIGAACGQLRAEQAKDAGKNTKDNNKTDIDRVKV